MAPPDPVHTDTDVLVVGGGLAGLAAASHAAREGARVLVLERAPVLGGRARSTHHDGFTLNLGAHALYRGGAAVRGLEELGVDLSGGVPGGDTALLGDAFVPLPQRLDGLLRAQWLGGRGRVQVARFFAGLWRRPRTAYDGVAWGDHVRAGVTDPAARTLLLAAGRIATYTADEGISARAVLTNLRASMIHGVVYLDGGWQGLVDRLAAVAEDHGVAVRAGAGRVTLERTSSGRVRARSNDGVAVTAPSVVVAVGPPRATRPVVASLVGAGVLADLDRRVPLRVAAMDVALRRLPCPDRSFVLGLDTPTYLSVHSDVARLAPDGGAVVHLARYLRRDEQAGPTDRARLEDLLDRCQPGWHAEVVDARFLPDMTVVGDLPLASHGGLAGRVPVEVADGVYLAGDWVGPDGLLSDTVLASARRAGRAAARHARRTARAGREVTA